VGEVPGTGQVRAACEGKREDLVPGLSHGPADAAEQHADVALLSWRAQRGAQAVGQVDRSNKPDDVTTPVEPATGLLSAAHDYARPNAWRAGHRVPACAVRASAAALVEC
jgi:hypothetical protein